MIHGMIDDFKVCYKDGSEGVLENAIVILKVRDVTIPLSCRPKSTEEMNEMLEDAFAQVFNSDENFRDLMHSRIRIVKDEEAAE